MSLLFSLAATTTKRGRFGRNYGRSRYQKYAVTIPRLQMADPIGLIQSPILAGLQRCLITFLTAITFALSAIGSTFADGSGMPNESCPQSSLCERPLCVPKIRFCNIDGEGRQGQVVRRRRRGAQSRDGEGRPCSGIDGSSTHYNRRHIRVGSGAGALRQIRSCNRDIRGGSSR